MLLLLRFLVIQDGLDEPRGQCLSQASSGLGITLFEMGKMLVSFTMRKDSPLTR